MFARLMLTLVVQSGAPQPLGVWEAGFAGGQCTAARSFDDQTVVRLSSSPLSETIVISLVTPTSMDTRRNDAGATLLVEPDGRAIRLKRFPRESGATTDGRVLTVFYTLGDDDAAALARAATPAIRIDTPHPVRLALHDSRGALSAIDNCKRHVAKSWGIPDAEQANIAATAKMLNAEQVYDPKDYPVAAMRAGLQGKVGALFEVGIDGRVRSCRPVVPSGVASLDEQTCTSIVTRARFTPATDRDGRPVAQHVFRWTYWTMP